MANNRKVVVFFLTSIMLIAILPFANIGASEGKNTASARSQTATTTNNYAPNDWTLTGQVAINENIRYEPEKIYSHSTNLMYRELDNIDYDDYGNIYIATTGEIGQFGGYSYSGRGFYVMKFDPSGDLLWGKRINSAFCGTSNYDKSCNVISINVVDNNRFYLTLGINNIDWEQLEFNQNLSFSGSNLVSNPVHIVAYFNNSDWEWYDSVYSNHNGCGSGNGGDCYESNLRHIGLNSDDELITVREHDSSSPPPPGGDNATITVTSYNDSGLKWNKEFDYTFDEDRWSPILSDINGNNVTMLIHSFKSMEFDGQEYSCPINSEFDLCLMRIGLDSDGNMYLHQAISNPRVKFTSMNVFQGDLLLGGVVWDWVNSETNDETNFTGNLWRNTTLDGDGTTYVVCKLTSTNWGFTKHFKSHIADWTKHHLIEGKNIFFEESGNTILILDTQLGYFNVDNSTLIKPNQIDLLDVAIISLDSAGQLSWDEYVSGENGQLVNSYNLHPVHRDGLVALPIRSGQDTIHSGIFYYGNFTSSYAPASGNSYDRLHYSSTLFLNTTTGTWSDEIGDQYRMTSWVSPGSYTSDQIWDIEQEILCPLDFTPSGDLLAFNCIHDNYDEEGAGSSLNYKLTLHSVDEDNDNLGRFSDNCPTIQNINQENYDGDDDGDICDNDDDNDLVADIDDLCQKGLSNWNSSSISDHDNDGCQDVEEDMDDDNDGISDSSDICPLGLIGSGNDHDGEGCKDAEDSDDDNDLISDGEDFCSTGVLSWLAGKVTDHDGDGCNDELEDTDDDNDGILDVDDQCHYGEVNWISNFNTDFDGDGCLDGIEDEDNDDDGVYNFADMCQYSNGSVDANGCTSLQLSQLPTDSDNNNTIPSIMYVCEGGTAVVLDIGDCPQVQDSNESTNNDSNQTDMTQSPAFYYVCPGGQMVVIDFADCPEQIVEDEGVNLSELSVDNLTLILSPNSSMPQGFVICPSGTALVIDITDCPGTESGSEQQNDDSSSIGDSIASGGSNDDQTLIYMAGGAFILSIITILVVVLKPSGSREVDDIDLMMKSHHSDDIGITRPAAIEKIEQMPAADAPPKFAQGSVSEGYEWIKWPEGSKQDWYRTPGSNSDWEKWQ